MVQDQLVEYISTQLKLGVSRDAIKSALTGVGWVPLDVEDTLKKVESAAAPASVQPAVAPKTVQPISSAASPSKFVSFSMPGTVASPTKNPEPQTVRVSDLVSATAPASGTPLGSSPKIISSGVMKDMSKAPLSGASSALTVSPVQKKRGIGLFGMLAIILIVLLGALAGYLFMQNNKLNAGLQVQSGQSQSVVQNSASQIQELNASNAALTAEIASTTAANQNLMTNLSFFVLPVGMSATSTPVSVSGVLAAGLGKNTYLITTSYGVKVYVKNSADQGVAAALEPLLGTTVQLAGTYIPGTPNVTVTSVNGASTVAPTTAASSTTSTTTTP